ncbi:glycosyltransferase family 2 protein [Lacinutrix iliipiscaria]|uniref:Glycosyltransferase family 2 protein n=1 Tax=Lacinutrix iliipiscaria TaxID=1230532 RepID=A0ABW5WQD1_9FLAO
MLSILIPTYHYNVYPLAMQLEQQALVTGINYEIICLDDGSFSHFNTENQKINTLANCKFIEAKKNKGRTATRQKLAEIAQYQWLLFLDADTLPTHSEFIKNILTEINSDIDIIFGGIVYETTKPNKDKLLRWHYGKARESKSVFERQKAPYTSIISGSFVIKKDLFIKVNQLLLQNAYGLDILFTAHLKGLNVKVKHINNTVYHLGLETNEDYLKKTKKALDTLYQLKKSKAIRSNATKLLKTHSVLKTLGLASVFGKLIKNKTHKIEHHLMSSSPSLFLFDLYRLGYFCSLKF